MISPGSRVASVSWACDDVRSGLERAASRMPKKETITAPRRKQSDSREPVRGCPSPRHTQIPQNLVVSVSISVSRACDISPAIPSLPVRSRGSSSLPLLPRRPSRALRTRRTLPVVLRPVPPCPSHLLLLLLLLLRPRRDERCCKARGSRNAREAPETPARRSRGRDSLRGRMCARETVRDEHERTSEREAETRSDAMTRWQKRGCPIRGVRHSKVCSEVWEAKADVSLLLLPAVSTLGDDILQFRQRSCVDGRRTPFAGGRCWIGRVAVKNNSHPFSRAARRFAVPRPSPVTRSNIENSIPLARHWLIIVSKLQFATRPPPRADSL